MQLRVQKGHIFAHAASGGAIGDRRDCEALPTRWHSRGGQDPGSRSSCLGLLESTHLASPRLEEEAVMDLDRVIKNFVRPCEPKGMDAYDNELDV